MAASQDAVSFDAIIQAGMTAIPRLTHAERLRLTGLIQIAREDATKN